MNILVTGGGTSAPIDDVRAITNRSSGRFSSQLTEAFVEQGHRVWHLSARRAEKPFERLARFDPHARPEVELQRLASLGERVRALAHKLTVITLTDDSVDDYANTLQQMINETRFDAVVLGMAVSDFEPTAVQGKIESRHDELLIRCRPTSKVINAARGWAPEAFLVGFKLLSGATESELEAAARKLIAASRADLIVAHDLKYVHTPDHTIFLLDAGHSWSRLPRCDNLAAALVPEIVARVR